MFGFSRDGRRLRMLVANEDGKGPGYRGTVRELDLTDGRLVRTYPTPSSPNADSFVYGVFAEDGSDAVIWTDEVDEVIVVDFADGSRTPLRLSTRPAESVGFRPVSTGVAQL